MNKDNKKIKRDLFDKLNGFYHDKDFVVGVMSNLKNDDDRLTMIEYINIGKNLTVENIILLSLDLNIKRKQCKLRP